ncbi:MAG: WG repeat-containing protein [bacterium]
MYKSKNLNSIWKRFIVIFIVQSMCFFFANTSYSQETAKKGLFRKKIGDKWGFIDKTGKLFTELFDKTSDFSEGLAGVKVGDKWGYIDKTGKMVIQPKFETQYIMGNASEFSEGLARVFFPLSQSVEIR